MGLFVFLFFLPILKHQPAPLLTSRHVTANTATSVQDWATEAALSLAIVGYNLCTLFQRKLGWQSRVTAATLRFRLFTTGGIISNKAGRTTIRLGVSEEQRQWWREVLAKLLCEFPNCNAVSQSP